LHRACLIVHFIHFIHFMTWELCRVIDCTVLTRSARKILWCVIFISVKYEAISNRLWSQFIIKLSYYYKDVECFKILRVIFAQNYAKLVFIAFVTVWNDPSRCNIMILFNVEFCFNLFNIYVFTTYFILKMFDICWIILHLLLHIIYCKSHMLKCVYICIYIILYQTTIISNIFFNLLAEKTWKDF